MTTHKNTPEQQYHHAPLNGLAIGAIIGAVMATFTGVFMFLIEFFLFADHISLAA